jgi:magnesium transporter
MYYVGFTICTLSASFIFYQGLNTNDPTNIISLICGFLLEFVGIALLTISRYDDGTGAIANQSQTGTGDYHAVAPNYDEELGHDVELRSL